MRKIPELYTNIPGSAQYQVSNYGNVRRQFKNGNVKPLKQYVRLGKHKMVKIKQHGVYKEHYVHRIVGATFLGPPPSPGMVLYHKNGITTDNDAGNLAWTTRTHLGHKTGGLSVATPVVQLDPITGEEVNWYKSISAAARDNYIHKTTIWSAIHGRLSTAAGYKWRLQKIYNCR